MSANPYWLGRLFSLADKLHWNYCRLEHNGETPPQLLGNSMMPTALDNPVAGLARLAERLPLYLRKVPLWLRQEVAEVEQKIDKENLPNRCTDADKAQMLLGYLARPDLEKAEDNPDPQTGDNS